MSWHSLKWHCLVVGLFGLAGCTSGGLQRVAVSGTVTLDGQAVEEGSITFIPTEGNQGPSAGGVIQNGRYQIAQAKGVVVGNNRVEIHGNRKTGRMVPDPMNPKNQIPELVDAFPPRFNSESTLVRDVQAGSGPIDFDLSSK